MTFDGRRPLMEDDLWWKTTFDGRRPSMEDDLRWKTTFDGRRPLMEDDLWWKTTFDGRQPLMEDTLWWKTTFDGRRQWGQPQKHCWKGHSAGHIPPALRYFWGSLHFLCCLHILYHLHFWVGIILSSSNLFGFLGYFHIWGHTDTEGFWAKKKMG